MTKNVAASTSGMVSATTRPARQPSARNETTSTMPSASASASQELVDRLADDLRLVGDLAELDADRQVALDALQRLLDFGADHGDVGARRHGGAEQHRLAALIAGLGGGRVLEAALDLGDVAEPERLLPGAQPQLANVLDRL